MFLEISQNSQENTCARASFLIMLHASACNFIKKRGSDTGAFPANCAKFLRTPFLREHLWCLLLYFEKYCPLYYIVQRYHLYFRFIVYLLRTLISRCTSCWQFLRKRWLVKSYPLLFYLQILNHTTKKLLMKMRQ